MPYFTASSKAHASLTFCEMQPAATIVSKLINLTGIGKFSHYIEYDWPQLGLRKPAYVVYNHMEDS